MVLIVILLIMMFENSYQEIFPQVYFMDRILDNHSYVDLTTVGNLSSSGVQCITDLSSCCSNIRGRGHRGDWYFPNGTRLPNNGTVMYEYQMQQRVDIRVNSTASISTIPSGIYYCRVPTIAVVQNDNDSSVRDTIAVGLYNSSRGGIVISSDILLDSEKNTLTCISTGGPATTVTWTRHSTILTEGTATVLNDPVTATYTHTLTVTSPGIYTCTVSNNKPSSASTTKIVNGASPPTNVAVFQSSATSITVTWTPPSPLGNTTGYKIFYTSGEEEGSDTVSGGSTNNYTLTGLTNGEIYNISVVSMALDSLFSPPVGPFALGLVPNPAPVIHWDQLSATATTITIAALVNSSSVVTTFRVYYTQHTCAYLNLDTNIILRANYTIDQHQGDRSNVTNVRKNVQVTTRHRGEDPNLLTITIILLRPGTVYSTTVKAVNKAGLSLVSNTITAMTLERAPSGAPLSFRVGNVTTNSVTVHWWEVLCIYRNGHITGYTIIAIDTNESVIGRVTVGSGSRQATVTGLSPSTVYTVSVAAVNSAGIGPMTSGITVRTLGVSSPTNVVAVQSSATSITVTWTPPSPLGNTTGYKIFYTSGEEEVSDTVSGGSANNHTLTGLTNGEIYNVSIMTTSLGSLLVTPVEIFTIGLVPIPAPVIHWDRSSVTATSITITNMVNSSSAVTTFRIRYTQYTCAYVYRHAPIGISDNIGQGDDRSSQISETKDTEIFTGRKRAAQESFTITISSLRPGTMYSITVRAVNEAGLGPVSNTITATTLEAAPSGAPLSFRVGNVTTNSVTVHWREVLCIYRNGQITGYTIIAIDINESVIGRVTVGSGSRQATVTGLSPSTVYTVSVAAVNSAGTGPMTSGISVRTLGQLSITCNLPNVVFKWTSTQIIITCISTGGPATTVTWTRGSTIFIEGTETVLNDPITATYTHTLTVTGGVGNYTCTVANGFSNVSTIILLKSISPPIEVTAVQDGPTSVLVEWTPSNNATGYWLEYCDGEGHRGQREIAGNATSDRLTDLVNGHIYSLSIVAVCPHHLASSTNVIHIPLIPPPGDVIVEVVSITATSISLSWSVASGSVSSWDVVWRETDRGRECSSGSLSGTSYNIDQLDSTTNYFVRVTATNVAGNTTSNISCISTAHDQSAVSSTHISKGKSAINIIIGILVPTITTTVLMLIAILLWKIRRNFPAINSRDSEKIEATDNDAHNVVKSRGDGHIAQNPTPPDPQYTICPSQFSCVKC